MQILPIVKLATSSIVGLGTGKIAHAIIRNNIEPETVYDTVAVASASFVIAGIAVDATKQYTNDMIDDIAKTITEIKNHGKTETPIEQTV